MSPWCSVGLTSPLSNAARSMVWTSYSSEPACLWEIRICSPLSILNPPASERTSLSLVPPRSDMRPVTLTSPVTMTHWLRYSSTSTSTCGSTR